MDKSQMHKNRIIRTFSTVLNTGGIGSNASTIHQISPQTTITIKIVTIGIMPPSFE
jgi:hypothetical protein